MKRGRSVSSCVLALFASLGFAIAAFAASNATITGRVVDLNNAMIPKAKVTGTNIDTNVNYYTETNNEGIYVLNNLPPGRYRLFVSKEGFKTIVQRDIVLHVQDVVSLGFIMELGSIDQSITVDGGASLIKSESASVGTLVDRKFVENLPLNGRSFQSLITLSPGVVLTKITSNGSEQGQFSVNGQRADANYFIIDGVSANLGISAGRNIGQSTGGSLPGLSASGGTNNLVSVDALQEFKIQTSTYAPEFGRTPGAQISIVTRSGSNEFRGAAFEYFRNDALDANDWFANRRRAKRPALRQNIFGGVLGGPVLLPRFGEGGSPLLYDGRNRTFFFFSYEGQRLRLPKFISTDVPSLAMRQSALEKSKPFLNAFPLPTGPARADGFAEFSASVSNPLTLNSTSMRIDHSVGSRLTMFGRYNHTPSSVSVRDEPRSLSNVATSVFKTQTITSGATLILRPNISTDFRVNYSRYKAGSFLFLDDFGGATIPSDSILFPAFASSRNSQFIYDIYSGRNSNFNVGTVADNLQEQVNIVENLSVVAGGHQLKAGMDYRRLSPVVGIRAYAQSYSIESVSLAAQGIAETVLVNTQNGQQFPLILNLSVYGQDTWKMTSRLALTYGLRWEYNPPPREKYGNDAFAITDLATLSIAPRGTSLYNATYNNFAPRIGLAYQILNQKGKEIVLRGGFGIFYDLGNNQATQAFGTSFPFTTVKRFPNNIAFPLSPAEAEPPPFSLKPSPTDSNLYVADPHLKLPYTYQWNVAAEQSLGSNQTLSASYVAAVGRRLLRQEGIRGTANFANIFLTKNAATSDYHAMQLQFQRRLSRGLQALASYNWSKSLDTASNDSSQNTPSGKLDPQLDRGPSDFDVRQAFAAAVTYNISASVAKTVLNKSLLNWSVDAIFTARSSTPVNIIYNRNLGYGIFSFRPDLVLGIPLYQDDLAAGGGRRVNNTRVQNNPRQIGPFSIPVEPRQGTLGRNALRGFPVSQVDLAMRRQFYIAEKLNLQLKAELFNLFNHPNFGDPSGFLGTSSNNGSITPLSLFGQSTLMFGRSLGSGGASGGFNPLFQIGGPRSIQLSLKFLF